jgi:cytochrome P450
VSTLPMYDPLDPAVIASPYEAYDALRDRSPFWNAALSCWVVMKYDDCVNLLKDTQTFASDWRLAGIEAEDAPGESLGIQSLDGLEHRRLRSSFSQAMKTVGESNRAQTGVRASTRTRLHAVSSSSGVFDFVATIARPVALEAVCRVLGIQVPDEASFAELAEDLVRGMDAGLIPERAEPAQQAKERLNLLIAEWSRFPFRAESSGVLRRALDSAPSLVIPEDQVISTARQLFLAGYSTTVAAAANVMLAISSDSDLGQLLQQDSRLIPATVEELLRLDGPVQGTSRAVTSSTVLGHVLMQRGDIVLCLFGAANRDPGAFRDANTLDVRRQGRGRHLGFGWGPHACTGAVLARDIIQVLVEEVLAVGLPTLAGEVSRVPRATLRYPDRLPLRMEPQ